LDEAQDLISAYLQGMRDKLDHPDTTLADLQAFMDSHRRPEQRGG